MRHSKHWIWVLLAALVSILVFMFACSKDENPVGETNKPPAQPTIIESSTPQHGSTGESINPTLRWECSDPDGDTLTYDVHFGVSSTPPLVSSNQSGTSYSPDTLEYNQKYHWRIVAKDTHGASTSSDTWHFTTEAESTETISTPTKPDGPDGGEINEDLTYTTGGASSSLDHSLQYQFDWDDGSFSDWSSSTSTSHRWSNANIYYVRSQARCATHTDATSHWSVEKHVEITSDGHEVNSPNKPSGSEHGFVNQTYTYTTGGSQCSKGHPVQYRLSWGTGEPSPWFNSASAQHSWSSSGEYSIGAQARCGVDTTVISDWSASMLLVYIEEQETISIPCMPTGPSSCQPHQSMSFSTGGASSNLGHSLQYCFDWGDGNVSDWSSLTSVSHSWSSAGTYNIRAQARCAVHTDAVSEQSNPWTISVNSLELIASYSTQGEAVDVFVSGGYAYILSNSLEIVNISVPFNPLPVGSISLPWGHAGYEELFVSDNYVYWAASVDGLKIYDVSDMSNPRYVTSVLGWQDVTGVHVFEEFAYLATSYSFAGKHGLAIVDVSNISDLRIVGWYETEKQAEKVFVVWPYAYLLEQAGFVSWLRIINVSDPLNPAIAGNFQLTFDFAGEIYVSEQYAYVAGWNWTSPSEGGLQIIDVSNPSSPNHVGTYIGSGSDNVFVSGHYAFLGEGSHGLTVLDVSDRSAPVVVGCFDCPVAGVHVWRQYVYVACYTGSIQILRFQP